MHAYDAVDFAWRQEQRQAVAVAELVPIAEPIAGGMMCYDGPGSWANQACGMCLAPPGESPAAFTPEDMDRLIAFYDSRACDAEIQVAPSAHPTLRAMVIERGFEIDARETVCACPVPGALPAGPSDETPFEMILIRPGETRRDLVHDYIVASSVGFVDEGETLSDVRYAIAERVVHHPRSMSLLVRDTRSGTYVGGAGVEYDPTVTGLACMFGASVAPEARRQGVQQMLMRERIRLAIESGCRDICVLGEPGGPTVRNAGRVGMAEVYTSEVWVRKREPRTAAD